MFQEGTYKPWKTKSFSCFGKNTRGVSTSVRENPYEKGTAARENPCEGNKASYQEN